MHEKSTMKIDESTATAVMTPGLQASSVSSERRPRSSLCENTWQAPPYSRPLEGFDSSSPVWRTDLPNPTAVQQSQSWSPAAYEDIPFSTSSDDSARTWSGSYLSSPMELPATPEVVACTEPLINGGEDTGVIDPIMFWPNMSSGSRQSCGISQNNQTVYDLNIDSYHAQQNYNSFRYPLVELDGPNRIYDDTEPLTGMMAMGDRYMTTVSAPSAGSTIFDKNFSFSTPIERSPDVGGPVRDRLSHLPSRVVDLIEYYDRSVCPVLVAVDGPSNPYRVHILTLVFAHNAALVNAVAALAAHMLYLNGSCGDMEGGDQSSGINIGPSQRGVSEEALYYKTTSVNLLNKTTWDPSAVDNDAILVTLVVLSLLDVSSGSIAKSKSQMPAVRQILALHGSNTSEFLNWITDFFVSLDLMSAVINDRLAQHRNSILDDLDLSANFGALGHLAHCEKQIFQFLAGHEQGTRGRLTFWSERDVYSPVVDSCMGLAVSAPMMKEHSKSDSIFASTSVTDYARPEFWSEWTHVRTRLHDMSRHTFSLPSTLRFNTYKQDTEVDLVCHAMGVFKHASLLFAERLAFPHVPPSSHQLQQLVSAALHHISSIPEHSAVNRLLLWPIIVLGTECVQPMHRDVIRLRCGDSMRENGFFAGLSGLEILGRVWAADDACWDSQTGMGWDTKAHIPSLHSLGGQAGRWRRAMCTIQFDL